MSKASAVSSFIAGEVRELFHATFGDDLYDSATKKK
jgi:hypothetical protein